MEDIEKIVIDKIDSMRDEIVKFHQQIVQMPSEIPPGKFREISKFVAGKMKEIGIDAQVKRNNVIGEMGQESGPGLILYGHIDTIPASDGWTKDPFGGEITEEKIFGRGAADDKACVTATIFAAKALIDSKVELNGKLILTAVAYEEIGGIGGAEYIVGSDLVKADACLLGDLACDYPIGYFGGCLVFQFIIKGKRAHAQAYPDVPLPHRNKYSGINAIHKMVPIIDFLMELQEEFKNTETKCALHPDYSTKISTVNIAQVEGGDHATTVPDKCNLFCTINTIPEQELDPIKEKVFEFIEKLKNEDPDLDITVSNPLNYNPFVIDTNSRFANIVKSSFKTVFNEERDFKTFMGTSDGPIFQEKGIETIGTGALRGDNNYHAQDEFVYIDDLMNITKIYAIIALKYLI